MMIIGGMMTSSPSTAVHVTDNQNMKIGAEFFALICALLCMPYQSNF